MRNDDIQNYMELRFIEFLIPYLRVYKYCLENSSLNLKIFELK